MASGYFGGAYFGEYVLTGTVPVGVDYAFTGDLQTVFAFYLDTLRDSAVVPPDLDSLTLVYNDVTTMRANSNSEDDINTAYWEYLH